MKRLNADEPLNGLNPLTIGDFWAWAYSDILSNRNRSIFAEFLVGAALGVLDSPRIEWDAVDLRYRGKAIEVKSAGYVQSWEQNDKLSKIVFDIGEKVSWDAETNTYSSTRTRFANCYVFCLYKETDAVQAQTSVLEVEQWQFYVVHTDDINRLFARQKKIVLGKIAAFCEPVLYRALREHIEAKLQLNV
jgi:hypothetical protein